jgi:hypothetical protein
MSVSTVKEHIRRIKLKYAEVGRPIGYRGDFGRRLAEDNETDLAPPLGVGPGGGPTPGSDGLRCSGGLDPEHVTHRRRCGLGSDLRSR